jgi:hypothetical protein
VSGIAALGYFRKLGMKRRNDTDYFALGILSFFGLVIGAVTLVVLYLYPVMVLTCRYEGQERVDCQTQEKMLGLIVTEELYLSDVKDAYVASETYERLRPRRHEVDSKVYKLMLITSSGTVELDGLDEFGGIFVNQSVESISDYLSAPREEPLRVRQATWVPLLVSAFFLLVSLIMLYSVVDTAVRRAIRRKKG